MQLRFRNGPGSSWHRKGSLFNHRLPLVYKGYRGGYFSNSVQYDYTYRLSLLAGSKERLEEVRLRLITLVLKFNVKFTIR